MIGKDEKALIVSILIAAVLSYLAYRIFALQTFIFISASLFFVSFLPYLLLKYSYVERIRKMEERFPDFLRDLAEATRSGMSLPEAIKFVSKADYGELTPAVRKMALQIDWGVPFPEVMNRFIRKMKRSKFITRGMRIVMEAYNSGGNITKTLENVAATTVELREMEKNREAIFAQQATMIMIIHLIFIGVLVSLFKVLVPIMVVKTPSEVALLPYEVPSINYYRSLFFLALLVEGICNGFLAGYVKDRKIISGIRYGVILGTVSVIAFSLFIMPKAIDFSIVLNKDKYTVGDKLTATGYLLIDGQPAANQSVCLSLGKMQKCVYTDENGNYQVTIPLNQSGEFYLFAEAAGVKKVMRVEVSG